MGGHAVQRGEPAYADAARLGGCSAQHITVATGGGPGAMEAANLGARLAGRPHDDLDEALAALAAVPSYRPSVGAWAERGPRASSDALAGRTESLGIPTWHYGHEPPNVFATAIAKYFRNATREAILLRSATPASCSCPAPAAPSRRSSRTPARTTTPTSRRSRRWCWSGAAYWTETLPAWPLLQRAGRGRPMEPHVHLVDAVEEAANLLEVTDAGPRGRLGFGS